MVKGAASKKQPAGKVEKAAVQGKDTAVKKAKLAFPVDSDDEDEMESDEEMDEDELEDEDEDMSEFEDEEDSDEEEEESDEPVTHSWKNKAKNLAS